MQGLTEEVASFIVNTTYRELPEEALRLAKRCLIDGTGVILSGVIDKSTSIMQAYLSEVGGKPESAVLGSRLRLPAAAAALANGTSGHAQDFDDTQLSASPDRISGLLTHPTTPVLAATYALGEKAGINGEAFLTAFSLGFEVECKIAEAINPLHYRKGYHTTGTIGAFGSTAAAGKILDLSEREMRYALGIAASESSGIRANFGTMTKPFHAGRAAENGIIAARLAKRGFTADPDILENPWGYFKILGDGFEPEKIVGQLGNPYSIIFPGVSIKPYPCGVLSHPSMNAMLDLVREHDLRPDDVDEIRVYAGSNILDPLRYALPQTSLEAKFSLPFCLTSILLRRKAGIREFSDEFIKSAEVQSGMKRVKTLRDPAIEEQGYSKILSRIELSLKNGKILSAQSAPYKGGPENPLSDAELAQKFRECAGITLTPSQVEAALKHLRTIEACKDIREIIPVLLPD